MNISSQGNFHFRGKRFAVTLFLTLAFFVLFISPAPASTNSRFGEWLTGTNFLDVSEYSLATNHGAFLVGAGHYVFTNDVPPAHIGQSLFLYSGDTGLAISNSSILDSNYDNTFDDQINNSFTVSLWAKGWPGGWNPFVSKYGEATPSPSGWQVRADASARLCWTVRGAGGVVTSGIADGGQIDDLAASNIVYNSSDGQWHFYLCTFDANKGVRELYVDGQKLASETNVTAYTLAPLEHLCIGARDENGTTFGNFFAGEIFDVTIRNYPVQLDDCGPIPLVIVTEVLNVPYGQSVQLNNGSMDTSFTYRWYSNGVPVLNAISNILVLTNVTASATYELDKINACDQAWPPQFFNVNVITPPPSPIRYSNSLVLTWSNGTLQQATNPLGPWTQTGTSSPYTNDMSTNSQMYFRLSYP